MCDIVDTGEDWIQNAILTAIDNIISPKIELAVRSINASSGRHTTSVTTNSERGERVEITAILENVSEKSKTFHELSANDETRNNLPDKVGEL